MTFAQIRNYVKGLFNPILDSLKDDIDKANNIVPIGIDAFNNLSNEEKNNGKAYFIQDININNGKVTYTGFTPIGTIISVMGNHAPTHYLICDGTEYNISDYQDLADYFEQEFGSKNYFGGDGTSTFAVPNLINKFIKGSDTSGVTEDAGLPDIQGTFNHDWGSFDTKYTSELGAFTKGSSVSNAGTSGGGSSDSRAVFQASNYNAIYGNSDTVTPENISVLYCIAIHDICIDANHNYSLKETVIGNWIDGKPLYQKTYEIGALLNKARKTVSLGLDSTIYRVVNWFGYTSNSDGTQVEMLGATRSFTTIGNNFVCLVFATSGTALDFVINSNADLRFFTETYVTIQYTKTTD